MRKNMTIAIIAIFAISLFTLVFLPSLYLISLAFIEWKQIYDEIFANPYLGSTYLWNILKTLYLSFRLALITVIIDVILGLPLAYIFARKNFRGKDIIEDITMLPLVIPTSGFGFATLITWTSSTGIFRLLGLNINTQTIIPLINLPFLVLIVHISLTFPYIVKTVSAALQETNPAYDIISQSLGASPLTTFRKVTLPLITPSLLSGSVLAFARSLGETGATLIVAGVSVTAPIAIVKWELENKLAPAAFLGSLLIALSFLLIIPIEYYSSQKRRISYSLIPKTKEKIIVKLEKKISKNLWWLRETASGLLLFIMVILPILTLLYTTSVYWSSEPYTGRFEKSIVYELFGPSKMINLVSKAIVTSIIVSSLATFISIYISIPTVLFIVKTRYGEIIRTLLKVPLVVPTSALGLSMILLWGNEGFNIIYPSIWLTILTHVVFSVPVIVEAGVSAYRQLNVELYEGTARTLGATFYDMIETVSLPMIKKSFVAGSILAFTHSLGETGATFLVMGNDITISTLVVNLVESQAIGTALFSSSLLIIVALVLLGVIRKITK
ncbi:MAG: iron ABC transporter permease [Thermoproteales archaeon]|nr:iron ABC transporter permease [Thermoproteales archaeon]